MTPVMITPCRQMLPIKLFERLWVLAALIELIRALAGSNGTGVVSSTITLN